MPILRIRTPVFDLAADSDGPVLPGSEPSGTRLAERTVAFESGQVVLGRSQSCDVIVDDPKCSRRHIAFLTLEGSLAVRDLASRNGSWINGERLVEIALAHDGDVVRVGDTEILVESAGDTRTPEGRPAVADSDETFQGESPPRGALLSPEVLSESFSFDHSSRALEPALPPADELPGDLLSTFLDLNRRLAAAERTEDLLVRITESALALTGADRGFLMRRDGDRLSFSVARTREGRAISSPSQEISRSVVVDAIRRGDAVMSGEARGDVRFEEAVSVVNLSLCSVLCVPLWRQETVAGILYVDSPAVDVFSEKERGLLGHLADQASIALGRAMLLDELREQGEALERSNREVQRLCRDLEQRISVQTEELQAVREELEQTRAHDKLRYSYDEIISASPTMREVFHVLDRVTDSDVPVLIEGESGTGKELIARALHFNSPRAGRPLQAINCAAVSESLLEAELFGVMRGAFTGADQDRQGLIELTNGGTLFLDEVAEMSLGMQAKLLRVLQEGKVRPVGGNEERPAEFRLVAATNRDLAGMVEDGSFRSDLYYRIRGVQVRLPPLRERVEDIPLLAEHFARLHDASSGNARILGAALLRQLASYSWPGNIRELEQEVRRLLALGGDELSEADLSPAIRSGSRPPTPPPVALAPGQTLRDVVDDLERRLLEASMERHDGNKTRVAEELGLSRPGLNKKLKRLGLE